MQRVSASPLGATSKAWLKPRSSAKRSRGGPAGRTYVNVSCLTATAQASESFTQLSALFDVERSVTLGPARHQAGLLADTHIQQGQVLLRVPLELCVVVDYNTGQGLQLPQGEWPRVRKGVKRDDGLPWDLLQALALVDGVAGDGDGFWSVYCNHVLPVPQQLTQPLALPKPLLLELQHPAISQGALEQKDRLQRMFPGLNTSPSPAVPSWIQWGLACVRSRAFKLGDEVFAFVPFLDVANHEDQPNANFRVSEGGGAVELVALADIRKGQEATISYTGEEGFTNQRMMAQYGFVAEGGNPADRLQLPLLDELAAAAAGHQGDGDDAQVAGLSLAVLQGLMGDAVWLDCMSGRNPYLFAALKSLPLAEEDVEAGGFDVAPTPQQLAPSRRAAAMLLDHVTAQIKACPTSLEQDLQLLFSGGPSGDPRMPPLLRYRYERKKLLAAAQALLNLYCSH